MAVGTLRCIVIDVNDLGEGERFWSALTGLPVVFSTVGAPTPYSRLGEANGRSILLQLVEEDKSSTKNRAHPDITVENVDIAVERAAAHGATLLREKDTYPLWAEDPFLEWAVMADPFGNEFCLIKDL